VGSTRAKVITTRVYLKLPATTTREGLLRHHWDVGTHGGGKECLSETSRPGLISSMRPYLPQSAHRLKKEDTLGGILFLGLRAGHLCPKDRVLNGSHCALLGAQSYVFSATRARKHKFEVPEGLPMTEHLKGDSVL
jgi:hypothetical protein